MIALRRRALVLGGGGTVGIAWEMGVAAGLLEGGIDLAEADLFVGTSAGSVVSTLLAAGLDPRQLLALYGQMASGQTRSYSPADPALLQEIFARWTGADEMTPELRREIGGLALQARTRSEAEWVGSFSTLIGGLGTWPERRLLLTAVDAATGELAVWSRESGVPIHRAVASSCTVPGLFPPVTIGEHRYVDGGLRSGTNADLAGGYETVLVIAPMASARYPLGQRQLAGELGALGEGGAETGAILPDEPAIDAFGIDYMEPAKVPVAAEHGTRQGKALAAQITGLWQ